MDNPIPPPPPGLIDGRVCRPSHEQTHILDLFGPFLDPIGYRLDLTTYYDEEEIPVRLKHRLVFCCRQWS